MVRQTQHKQVNAQTCMFLYCAVSSPWDCSKQCAFHPLTHLTLHPLTDLFVPTPSRLLWEAFGHAAIAARRPLIKSISVCSQILINTTEVSVATWGERNCQSFETPERCFETGFSFKPLRHQTQATRVCTTVYQICTVLCISHQPLLSGSRSGHHFYQSLYLFVPSVDFLE